MVVVSSSWNFCHIAGNHLERKLRRTQSIALAMGSKANLRSQGRKLMLFLSQHGSDLPMSEHEVCLYIQFLMISLKSPTSVRNYLSGAKFFHSMLEYDFPSLNSMEVRLTLRGMEKSLAHSVVKAKPIDVGLLRDIYAHLDMTNTVHVFFWCLFLFLFFLFARKSQFLPLTKKVGDVAKVVRRVDIRHTNKGLCCTFRWTKTTQTGKRVILPLVSISDSVLCPVSAYLRMIKCVPAPVDGPAFVLPGKKKILSPVTYRQFQSFLRTSIAATGCDPSGFSSHSFRRGGASFALKLGLPSELIQSQGNWLSDAYLGYLDITLQQRTDVAMTFAHAISG